MSLLDRLLNLEDPKIPVHQFSAAMGEYKRGAVTGGQVAAAFDLTAEEITQLQNWLANVDADTINRTMVHDVLLLGEVGLYTKQQVKDRLGVGD